MPPLDAEIFFVTTVQFKVQFFLYDYVALSISINQWQTSDALKTCNLSFPPMHINDFVLLWLWMILPMITMYSENDWPNWKILKSSTSLKKTCANKHQISGCYSFSENFSSRASRKSRKVDSLYKDSNIHTQKRGPRLPFMLIKATKVFRKKAWNIPSRSPLWLLRFMVYHQLFY